MGCCFSIGNALIIFFLSFHFVLFFYIFGLINYQKTSCWVYQSSLSLSLSLSSNLFLLYFGLIIKKLLVGFTNPLSHFSNLVLLLFWVNYQKSFLLGLPISLSLSLSLSLPICFFYSFGLIIKKCLVGFTNLSLSSNLFLLYFWVNYQKTSCWVYQSLSLSLW